MPEALIANLTIKQTDEIVYPNTVANNVAMGDGTTLTDFHSDMESFKTTQEQTNSTLKTWKDDTEEWKSTHTHTMSQITDLNLGNMTVGTANKVANDLVISINGGTTENDNQFTYNGSRRIAIDLDPDRLGAATYDHVHEASQIEGLDEAITDKINTIAPSGHRHDMSDINGLTEYITNAIDETDYDTTVPTTVALGGLAAGGLIDKLIDSGSNVGSSVGGTVGFITQFYFMNKSAQYMSHPEIIAKIVEEYSNVTGAEVWEILSVHSVLNKKHLVKVNCDYKILRTRQVLHNKNVNIEKSYNQFDDLVNCINLRKEN